MSSVQMKMIKVVLILFTVRLFFVYIVVLTFADSIFIAAAF